MNDVHTPSPTGKDDVMRGAGITLIAAVLTIFTSIGAVAGEVEIDEEEQQRREQELREELEELEKLHADIAKFQTAVTPENAGEAKLSLYWSPFMWSNEILVAHDDATVAVHAAWNKYSRMVPRRGVGFGGFTNKDIDPRDWQRFIGFLEGRMRIIVPDWWEEALADPEHYWPRTNGFDDGGWIDAQKLIVESSEKVAEVRFDFYDDLFSVPAETFKKLTDDKLGIAIDEKHAFLLNHSRYGFETKLFCVSRETSLQLWQADVWGLGPDPGAKTGSWPEPTYMEVDISNGKILVFLSWRSGVSVDAFSLADGTPLLRFATNNWGVKPKRNDRAP